MAVHESTFLHDLVLPFKISNSNALRFIFYYTVSCNFNSSYKQKVEYIFVLQIINYSNAQQKFKWIGGNAIRLNFVNCTQFFLMRNHIRVSCVPAQTSSQISLNVIFLHPPPSDVGVGTILFNSSRKIGILSLLAWNAPPTVFV